jgi:arginase family enzyme
LGCASNLARTRALRCPLFLLVRKTPAHVKVTMPDAAQPPAQPELPSVYRPGKRRGRARRTHTVAKVLLSTLLTLGMVSGLSVAFLYRHLNDNINVVDVGEDLYDRPKAVHIEAPKQPLNILVMGSDCSTSRPTGSRRTASRSRATRWSTGPTARATGR